MHHLRDQLKKSSNVKTSRLSAVGEEKEKVAAHLRHAQVCIYLSMYVCVFMWESDDRSVCIYPSMYVRMYAIHVGHLIIDLLYVPIYLSIFSSYRRPRKKLVQLWERS